MQVFAYGQTGSGKTYAMGTAAATKQVLSPKEESIIPKALQLVFDALSQIRQEYTTIMKVPSRCPQNLCIFAQIIDINRPREGCYQNSNMPEVAYNTCCCVCPLYIVSPQPNLTSRQTGPFARQVLLSRQSHWIMREMLLCLTKMFCVRCGR